MVQVIVFLNLARRFVSKSGETLSCQNPTSKKRWDWRLTLLTSTAILRRW